MPLPLQTPEEEFRERVGETATGLLVVPQLIAIDNFRRSLKSARDRVDESNAVMNQALGMEDVTDKFAPSDDMGDIFYTGDISVQPGQRLKLGQIEITPVEEAEKPAPAKPSTPKPEPSAPLPTEQTPDKTKWPRWMWPALAGLTIAGLSVPAVIIANTWFDREERPIVVDDSDWRLELEVRDHEE